MTDIRQQLVDANPVPRAEVPEALRAELFAEVRRTPPRTSRFRRRWPLPTILVGLVAAGGVATAGGLLISKETREQSVSLVRQAPSPGDAGPPVTYGDQIAAEAARIVATTPYPPGVRETFDFTRYGQGSTAPGEQRGSLQMFIEFRAACMWREYWLSAVQRGQTQAAREAAVILRQAVRWPGTRGDRGEGAARARRVATAAAARDVDTVEAITRGDCRDQP